MTISSKYHGMCRACGGHVFPGDLVEWSRGIKGVRHTDCQSAKRPTEPVAPTEFSASPAKIGDEWGVRITDPNDPTVWSGHTVTVQARSGKVWDSTLGEMVERTEYGAIYRVVPKAKRPEREVKVTEIGVYELPDGRIYVVKPNKDKSAMYAKRVVEIGGIRQNEDGADFINVEFEYERGAIFEIAPEHKITGDRAKALTIRYGRCIMCGRHLKAGESVEQGIGPVCVQAFPDLMAERVAIKARARKGAPKATAKALAG